MPPYFWALGIDIPGAMGFPREAAGSGGGNPLGAALAGVVLGAAERDPKARRREPTGGLKDVVLGDTELDKSILDRSGWLVEGERPGGLAKRRGADWSNVLGAKGLAITEAGEGVSSAGVEEMSERRRAPLSDEGAGGATGVELEDGVKDLRG